ncbi:VPLPA-CTERM sorting domain-containing protein [uncultured Tateyamaria sp.]|uniref:VPLPA-CTERM sorting domain-containing protein n=1 Tax=uncultured Tateyamaria sp. TaxID=455651 RepID=UPI0026388360|nr:VPLPA-CTERM sorting domain-containing protein [uncultured Tateyamaria sp.]
MKHFVFGAAALALATIGISVGQEAQAATDYEGIYEATSVNTRGNDHTVWLPGLFSGTDAYWQFTGGAGNFSVGAGNATASLGGTIDNNGDPNLMLELAVEYVLRDPNEPGVSGVKGGGIDGGLNATERAALIDTWSFFDIVSASLTGVGALEGLVLELTAFPTLPEDIPFQLGESANDKNQGLGGSGWFSWSIVSQATDMTYVALPNGSSNQHGDININLSAVPLPAGGVLLIGGLAALGAVRRRKKAA